MTMARGAAQDYAPYRQNTVDAATLASLYRLEPAIAARDTLFLWLQIFACWGACALWPYWWVVLAAIPLIGTRYYALYIIGHDGLHRRILPGVRANDWWNDALILGAIGAITRLNRHNHMRHHSTLALPGDPDRYKYVRAGRHSVGAVLWRLTGLPFVLQALGNVFMRRGARPSSGEEGGERYSARDLAILAAWQLALIGGLSSLVGWWAYPVLWLLPVYAFTFAADISRVFLEHSRLEDDATADQSKRLVTFHAPWWERVLLAPMNMNFHAAHHLWPAIPYYHLPAADAALRSASGAHSGLVWRNSYFGYLVEYLRAVRDRPGSTASA